MLFLEETVPPPPARVPVAWLGGEVRDEFLRFLEESRRQGEEHGRAARDGGADADGHAVDDDNRSFVDDDGGPVEEDRTTTRAKAEASS
ncbi:hypothetical protein HU200_015889 [Digitaria exilis]|uniref:Uncharacterized protein n=1 Tax=Digitaria exilis TaxID=1010633 RepID=A0A835F966_9POAL|nr:hypothetical protein HU200_015889 [Digitaria exilis]